MKNLKTISVFILGFIVLGSLASCTGAEEKASIVSTDKVVTEKMEDKKEVVMDKEKSQMGDSDKMMDKEEVKMEDTDKDDMMDNSEHGEWTEEEMKAMEDEKMMDKEEVIMMKGEYKEYSEGAVKNAKGDILLFFHANWCPTCVAFEKQVLSETIPDGLTLLKVNYDDSSDLKKKYSVLTQTTFVHIDNEGNMIKRWVGGRGIDSIIGKIK